MIKLIIGVIVVLALIGGAIQFKSDEQNWSFIINKAALISSVQSGVVKIYDFSRDLITEENQSDGINIIGGSE
ncbi:MAG TPA: hypothetical protein EYG35_01480 [Gammaproteobacteria bacterium]|jgi:hypothetical protein|nr:hypothetical protein [Gammaproteobacteria bacterium]